MTLPSKHWIAFVLALCVLAPAQSFAQNSPAPPANAVPAVVLPQDQLDALLAPIALYPDQLLSQVLMASTYPLDVVAAARFVQQNPGLQGEALNQALADKPWDPSVLSLTAFPQVLAMMNDKLEWTQQLGDAFLANEPQVMQTVQSLRSRAQAAGNLQSTPQQTVVVQDRVIVIEPAQPQYVYVPVYNPTVVYGPWWVPAYRPWYWYPPSIYGYPPMGSAFAAGIVWGSAWTVSANHWGWAHPNWRSGTINVNVNNNYFLSRPQYGNRYQNGTWQHSPEQRRGVAYRDPTVQNRYRPTTSSVQTREAYRGRENATTRPVNTSAGGAGMQRQATTQSAPATMNRQSIAGAPAGAGAVNQGRSVDRGTVPNSASMTRSAPTYNPAQSRPQTQEFSNRGAQSRAAMSAPPQRSAGAAAPSGGGGAAGRGGGAAGRGGGGGAGNSGGGGAAGRGGGGGGGAGGGRPGGDQGAR